MKKLQLKDVECLISWPKRSKGYCSEKAALATLISLCEEHGFGRVQQLVINMAQIWDKGDVAIKRFEEHKKAHFASLGWEN